MANRVSVTAAKPDDPAQTEGHKHHIYIKERSVLNEQHRQSYTAAGLTSVSKNCH